MKGFESYKGRTVKVGQVVKVYFNKTRKVWSIVCNDTKLVLGHTNEITLTGCTLQVGQKARLRCIRTKSKTPHAYIIGKIESLTFDAQDNSIWYNPYKHSRFQSIHGDVYSANKVSMLVMCDKSYTVSGKGIQ